MSVNANELEGFHGFQGPDDEEPHGSFEVFWVSESDAQRDLGMHGGWFWWACFPGCIPDCDAPSGPWETSREAWQDAQSF